MEQKSNKGIVLLLVILIILVSALIVLVVYKGFFAEKIETKDDSSTTTTTIQTITKRIEEEQLTQEEQKEIETFINKFENYAFLLFEYDNPNDILKEYDDTVVGNSADNLAYSIRSNFESQLTEEEINLISSNEEFFGETYANTIEQIEFFLKEKTNKNFDKKTIQNAFSGFYYKEIDKYVFYMTDTIFGEKFYVKNGYKKDNKIFVKVNENIELILVSYNDQYYFYSCDYNS